MPKFLVAQAAFYWAHAGVLAANNSRTGGIAIPQDWITFFVEFSN